MIWLMRSLKNNLSLKPNIQYHHFDLLCFIVFSGRLRHWAPCQRPPTPHPVHRKSWDLFCVYTFKGQYTLRLETCVPLPASPIHPEPVLCLKERRRSTSRDGRLMVSRHSSGSSMGCLSHRIIIRDVSVWPVLICRSNCRLALRQTGDLPTVYPIP